MAYSRRPSSGSRTTVRLPGGITISMPGKRASAGRRAKPSRRVRRHAPANTRYTYGD